MDEACPHTAGIQEVTPSALGCSDEGTTDTEMPGTEEPESSVPGLSLGR